MYPFLLFLLHHGARISHWTSGTSQELSHSRITVWVFSMDPRGEKAGAKLHEDTGSQAKHQSLQACYLTHRWVEIPFWVLGLWCWWTEIKAKNVCNWSPQEAEELFFRCTAGITNWQFRCLLKASSFHSWTKMFHSPSGALSSHKAPFCPWMDKLVWVEDGQGNAYLVILMSLRKFLEIVLKLYRLCITWLKIVRLDYLVNLSFLWLIFI